VEYSYNSSVQEFEIEYHKFKASMGYLVKPCLKKKTNKQNKTPQAGH
jgi:hypothetical protein